MSGPKIITYNKQYGMGGEQTEKTATEIFREQMINSRKRVLELHPILARGYFDGLIQYKENSDPPILEWKEDLINELPWERLYDIWMMCEKVKEEQTRQY